MEISALNNEEPTRPTTIPISALTTPASTSTPADLVSETTTAADVESSTSEPITQTIKSEPTTEDVLIDDSSAAAVNPSTTTTTTIPAAEKTTTVPEKNPSSATPMPHIPTFGAPTRQFLNQTVTTGLMEGMRYLVAQREVIEREGKDPLAVLGQYLLDLSSHSKAT